MNILERVYLDNGATSFPKAPGVAENMAAYILENGSSVSRGAYSSAMDASRMVYETRELLCEMFNFDHPDHVIFTKNITESLNQGLKGLIDSKDHVIISSMEHNAVMRPLNSIGCKLTRVQADIEGFVSPEDVEKSIQADTKAIVMIHGSNISGSVNDIEAIGRLAKKHGIYFIADVAQTAGVIDISMDYIDMLCFTGHKSLLGPTGTGGFLIQPELAKIMKPLIEGGTGSASEQETQPDHMPDKFESGTPNVVGICGLHTSLKYVLDKGIKNIHDHEMKLVKYFFDNFDQPSVRVVGSRELSNRTAVISLDFKDHDNAVIAFKLERNYHIQTRVGMHCAPSAHKTLGTFPNGTVRVSFSSFTTREEIQYLIDAIDTLVKETN
ncbi:aminotransferase class V-fold PLP-dependent enzyme [Acidaminobacter sp. JC074]|uniref:aminotransferase class V-fold PLP-dependent enzyme n=1 Tax=Acidaminobacter sp. JC074 TaxID=2530199 RepID=UPI001F0DA086|nr:aminotransferase class V-fold PLP-dependent enzyme [Acidaminobacter sp. JC074]MCH4887234.1 aminotransferase class V-fold PLP-dependent enzyme [Acidaminobacter sp. JC074]